MMSGIHEGKKEEEENTVELLRNLVSSDDEETNVPQVPVELDQGGAAEEAGLAQVGPVHRSEERPTWGKAPPGQRSEDYDDDDDEEKMEQDFYPDLAKLQREAYNSHVGYDKVKREITKRSRPTCCFTWKNTVSRLESWTTSSPPKNVVFLWARNQRLLSSVAVRSEMLSSLRS
jgi:hypothetical protein